jgi:hypothetical protein
MNQYNFNDICSQIIRTFSTYKTQKKLTSNLEARPSLKHPASYRTGIRGVPPPEVNRPGNEATYSLQTSVEVNKVWINTSTPLYIGVALN